MTLSKNRAGILTAGATISAAIIMVFFFKAPVLPVALGAIIATLFILRRKPEA